MHSESWIVPIALTCFAYIQGYDKMLKVMKLFLLISKSRLCECPHIGKEIYGSYYPIDAARAAHEEGWNAEPCDNQELNHCLTSFMCPCVSFLICTRKETKFISLCKSTWRYFDKLCYSNTAFSKVSPLCTAKARLKKPDIQLLLLGIYKHHYQSSHCSMHFLVEDLGSSLARSRSQLQQAGARAEEWPSPGLLPVQRGRGHSARQQVGSPGQAARHSKPQPEGTSRDRTKGLSCKRTNPSIPATQLAMSVNVFIIISCADKLHLWSVRCLWLALKHKEHLIK